MKLLEKDIHEKQDTIVSLRRQLEDIKQINLEMYNKLQVSDNVLIDSPEICFSFIYVFHQIHFDLFIQLIGKSNSPFFVLYFQLEIYFDVLILILVN